ncbi:MAG: hypothetical protein N2504_05535 [candidate division WOR-3 bacterium]|nr:hypothetical protein [candidate division WOR-3 bacterium]MCX7948031.1 hypothetical protein [candidate division WOR-3 bacterium]MDW8151072.1 hypothetical protein [candidate division WOR-3 bacterium]
MIWIYVAILLIILFFIFGYLRELYTPKYAPSREIIRKVDEILKHPVNTAISLLKEQLKFSKISDKYYIYLNIAFLYMQMGQLEKALRLSRSLIVGAYIDENIRKRAILLVGEIYLKLNRVKEGLDFLLEHRIEDKNYYFLIAKFYEYQKDYKNSAYYYKKIIHDMEKQQFSNILSKLSISASRNGEMEISKKLIAEASKIYEDGLLILARGIYQFYSNDLERAIELFREGLNKSPNLYSLIKDELKEAYFEIGNFEDFLNYLKSVENPVAKLDYIRTLCNMGEFELARDFFYENKHVFSSNLNLISKVYQVLRDESVIKDILELARNTSLYRCSSCNGEFSSFYIECPNCYRIGTLEVIYERKKVLSEEIITEIPEEYIE